VTRHPEPPPRDGYVALGRVTATHALRGEVRLRLYNPDSTALDDAETVLLRLRDGSEARHTVRSLRPHKNGLLATFAGYDSIEAAEPLVGAEILMPVADLPPLAPGEVYHFQLVGLAVRCADGREIGRVTEVLDLPGHPVCVVRDGAREVMIPFVDAIVTDVDLDAGCLCIDPPAGLVDP